MAMPGHLTVYPSGTPQPGTSNLNWIVRSTVANLVYAPVGADGRVVLANASGGSVALVADVVGYVRGQSPAPMATIDYARVGKCSATDPHSLSRFNAPHPLALAPPRDASV